MTRVATLAAVAVLAAACSNTPGGDPLDGTWTQTGVSCDGTAMTLEAPVTLVIDGTAGSLAYQLEPGCTGTEAMVFGYPDADTFVLTYSGNITCDPAACAASCGTGTASPDETYSYTLSGNTLTISRDQSGNDAQCNNGQTVAYTFTR